MKKIVIGVMLLAGTGWGFRHPESLRHFALGNYEKAVNQAQALAKLREYQVAQNAYSLETDGQFAARLLDLYSQPGRGRPQPGYISEDLAHASINWPHPTPYYGYVFSDLTIHSNGRPVDRRGQFGLAAYPLRPGIDGDIVLLMLQDDTVVRPEDRLVELQDGGVTTGTHTIWARPFVAGEQPPARWPSPEDLARDYQRLDRSVEVGAQEMRALFDKARQAGARAGRAKEAIHD